VDKYGIFHSGRAAGQERGVLKFSCCTIMVQIAEFGKSVADFEPKRRK